MGEDRYEIEKTRWAAIFLAALLFAAELVPCAKAFAAFSGQLVLSDRYLSVRVSPEGSFDLKTVGGAPRREGDENAALLHESFASFRIGDEDFIFGRTLETPWGQGTLVSGPTKGAGQIETVWQVKGVQVTQILKLAGENDLDAGNLSIIYKVKNMGGQEIPVGTRLLLDTALGGSDCAPFNLPGLEEPITTESVFAPLPTTWRHQGVENNVVAWGRVLGEERPETMLLAHWAGISKYKYSYPDFEPALNYADAHNIYGTADSALALFWEAKSLSPGEERRIQFLYGLGDIQGTEKLNLDLRLVAPDMLLLNQDENGYVNNPFIVTLEIDHSLFQGGADVYEDIEATLAFPGARGVVKFCLGQTDTKVLSYIIPGTLRAISWQVEAINSYAPRVIRPKVTVKMKKDGEELEPITLTSTVLIPSLAGDPPPVQVLGLTPSYIYSKENSRKVSIRGSGLNGLYWDEGWTLYLEREADPSDVIPIAAPGDEEYMEILDDGLVNVYLPNELWGEDGGPQMGSYWLKLKCQDGEFSQKVTFTMDEAYRTFSYGVLAVTRKGWSYDLFGYENEETMKEGVKSQDEVLMTIRGDILRKTGQLDYYYSGPYYEIAPGAVISKMIHFDADDELTDLFGEGYQQMLVYAQGGTVRLMGAGALSLPNMHFLSGEFSLVLENNTRYSYSTSDTQPITFKLVPQDMLAMPLVWMTIFPVSVEGLTLNQHSVTFQGKLLMLLDAAYDREAFGLDPTQSVINILNASLDVQAAEYAVQDGKVIFKGIKGEGEIGLLDKVVPIKSMVFGARANAWIDSYRDYYRFEAALRFIVLEVDAVVELQEAKGRLYPEDLSFKITSKWGIPIIPSAPVVWIDQGGAV